MTAITNKCQINQRVSSQRFSTQSSRGSHDQPALFRQELDKFFQEHAETSRETEYEAALLSQPFKFTPAPCARSKPSVDLIALESFPRFFKDPSRPSQPCQSPSMPTHGAARGNVFPKPPPRKTVSKISIVPHYLPLLPTNKVDETRLLGDIISRSSIVISSDIEESMPTISSNNDIPRRKAWLRAGLMSHPLSEQDLSDI